MTTAVEQFSPTAKSPQVREFSAAVRQMQSDLATMSQAERVSQFGFSSLEDTALPVYDALGQARLLLGKQNDGSFAVKYLAGDPPPRPAGFIVSARQLAIYTAWDGTFSGGYKRPSDVARVDVHRSTVSGFTCDGTTIVGNIPEAGGILLGADSQTYYVRFVAVTHGGVASAPTDEIAVLPLPATQLAVGAVGAQQLAADIAFVSRMLVGDPNGAHLEFEGRAGTLPGIHLFNSQLDRTFRLDATTGDVFIKGQIRTADSGERLVWRETNDHDIRFYPATGNKWANLYARTFTLGGADYGGMLMQSALYNSRRSFIWVEPDKVELYRGIDGGSQAWCGFVLGDTYVDLTVRPSAGGTPYSQMYIDGGSGYLKWGTAQVFFGGPNGEATLMRDTSRSVGIFASALEIRHTSVINFVVGSNQYYMQGAILANYTLRSGFYFATTGVDIYNPVTGAPLTVAGKEFLPKSARETKTEIERPPFDSVAVIRDAPVSMFEYIDDQRDERGRYRRADKNFGPMADDVPQLLVRHTADGTPGVGLNTKIAVLWDASARHAETLDDQAETLGEHGRRLADLLARFDALEGR